MKKHIFLFALCLIFSNVCFGFFGREKEKTVLSIGVTPTPQGEILKFVEETFKNEDFILEIVEYKNYNEPNFDLEDGRLDANYFQHKEFLDAFNIKERTDLVSVGEIHFEKMGIYSNSNKSIKGLKGKIAIPNDDSNRVRALKLLEKSGLISLDENYLIVDNFREIEIIEVNSNYLYKIINEVDGIVINANFMLERDYLPTKEALYLETYSKEYTNLLVVNKNNKKHSEIERLRTILLSPEVKTFIKNNYKESLVLVD